MAAFCLFKRAQVLDLGWVLFEDANFFRFPLMKAARAEMDAG